MKATLKFLALGISLSALAFWGMQAMGGGCSSCGTPDSKETAAKCCACQTCACAAVKAPDSKDAVKACQCPSCACPNCSCAVKSADAKDPGKCCGSSGCCAVKSNDGKDGFQNLTTKEMEDVVASKKATVLDARSGKYDDGRRIPGAKSLNAKSSKEEVEALLKDKDAPIVTYCAGTKCPASGMLAKHLKSLGYTKIMEYPLGIEGWTEAGKEVEKSGK